jgi:hypothetical protein
METTTNLHKYDKKIPVLATVFRVMGKRYQVLWDEEKINEMNTIVIMDTHTNQKVIRKIRSLSVHVELLRICTLLNNEYDFFLAGILDYQMKTR